MISKNNIQLENQIKKQILPVQLVVTIIISYLTIFGPSTGKWVVGSYIFIAIFFSTNLLLSYIPNRYYYDKKIFYTLIFFNSIMICLGIYLSGNASTDFYLIYFLIIGLASMSTSLKYLMINTAVFTIVYGWILFEKGLLTGDMGTSYALRLPFMFIMALFFGSIVDALIKDKSRSIKASEEKYRSIVESTNDTVYMVDKNSRFLSANRKFLSEHRLTEEEIIGKNFFDFYSTEETKEFSNRADKVFETSQATHYEAFNKNLGKWVMRTLSPILEPDTGKAKAVSVISMNITERVKAEDELKKAQNDLERRVEERTAKLTKANKELQIEILERKRAQEGLHEEKEKFRFLVEELPIGVSVIGKEGHYKYLNPNFIEAFGYTTEDIPTGRDWFKKAYPDQEYRYQVSQIWKNDFDAVKTEESRLRTFNVRCKDGSKKVIQFRPVTMETGDQLVIYEDMTEQKRLEAQFRQAQKMEAIGALAGGVAHDLNNILSGIVSLPELLLMDLPQDSPLKKPILTIQKSGEKAATIVQDLLTLARRGVAVKEVVNLNHIIFEYFKSPQYEKIKSFHPDMQVETRIEDDILKIEGSSVHLEKTIMNLISNAAEAMLNGGKVTISAKNRYIDKPIKGYDEVKEGDYVVLNVADTGIGISPEDMKRIFEPFYTKKAMGRSGTGLGMAVVWGTVKDHKGYIDVKSTEGKGTTFTLYFPVTRKEMAKDESLFSMEDCIGHGESILVVDDVEEQREIASVMLRKLGYSVTSVSSGEEAMEYMKNNSADLLVLDMIMDPGINGRETYERIIKFHPEQKAIIASGFSETEDVKKALELGAGQYIKKPYTLEKIGIAVRDELKK